MSEKENNSGYLDMDLLRFTTAGSVDDGKSTLIGRLLYDSKAIFEDQLEAVEKSSKSRGDEHVNLALLTDGLRSEREQGITIEVAYRYLPQRRESSLSRILRAISNIQEIWSLELLQRIWQLY